jgi:2-keto-4-pentenoate hydratase/2-oxohepta-3-ene-1,7-dioic acid hydratase in catechol pathway
MKIARFTHAGSTRLGIIDGDTVIDVGSADASLPTDVGLLLARDGGVAALGALIDGAARLALADVRLEAPIAQPPVFYAIGLNYADHIAESGMGATGEAAKKKPAVPVVFNKQVTCVNAPFDPVEVPTVAPEWVDYEGELGIVIGTRCRNVSVEDAPSVIAGYLIVNDVSVRDWQRATPTMTMGKSWDTHGPIGPWMVTADEVGDPHNLQLTTWVNGEVRQNASTALMITNCWEQIAHISTACTLLPGTIIATGTPAGVGFAMKPSGCLSPGDVVRIEIEKLGAIEHTFIAQPIA